MWSFIGWFTIFVGSQWQLQRQGRLGTNKLLESHPRPQSGGQQPPVWLTVVLGCRWPDCRAALMAHFVPPSYTPFSCDSPPAMIELQSRSRPAHHSVLAAEPQCRLPLWDGWAGQTARHRRRLHLHHPPGRIRKTFLTACTDHSRPTLAPHPGTNHQPGLHSQSSH